jgi:hypothetical protein
MKGLGRLQGLKSGLSLRKIGAGTSLKIGSCLYLVDIHDLRPEKLR